MFYHLHRQQPPESHHHLSAGLPWQPPMGFPISKSLLTSATRAIILKHEPDLVTLCPELYGKSHFTLDKSWSPLALVHCISDISPSTISPCSPCYSHFNQHTVLQIHRACSRFGLWTGFSLCWRLLPPIFIWLPPAYLESAQLSLSWLDLPWPPFLNCVFLHTSFLLTIMLMTCFLLSDPPPLTYCWNGSS